MMATRVVDEGLAFFVTAFLGFAATARIGDLC
jgi:hypothetical protein